MEQNDLPVDQDAPQDQPEAADQPAAEAPADTSPRVALITGGASGLGLATAMELARRGWSLYVQHTAAAQAEKALSALQAAAAASGVEVVAAAIDLTSAAGREQLVEQVMEAFGRIDMLVNASWPSVRAGGDLLEMDEGQFRQSLDASLVATVFLTQLVANEMVRLVEAGGIESPRIVTINSINAAVTSVDSAAWCIGQAGLSMMCRLFADRLGEHGINVYEIRAGIIATGDEASRRYDSLIAQGLTPIRRWGRPGDVARVVAAIADDLLAYTTGEVIHVDGGFHVQRL